jgi:N-acetylglutamate synthase-like GNAT family acetyltransferase
VGAVLDRGGFIYFARLNGLIIGTCALLKVEDAVFEIAKMAVTEAYRSLGIGKMLMSTVIRKAKDMNVHKLVLYSNTTLIAAVNMYFRFGFRMIPKTDFHNNRANIKMEKILSNETTPFSYESLEEYSMEI